MKNWGDLKCRGPRKPVVSTSYLHRHSWAYRGMAKHLVQDWLACLFTRTHRDVGELAQNCSHWEGRGFNADPCSTLTYWAQSQKLAAQREAKALAPWIFPSSGKEQEMVTEKDVRLGGNECRWGYKNTWMHPQDNGFQKGREAYKVTRNTVFHL